MHTRAARRSTTLAGLVAVAASVALLLSGCGAPATVSSKPVTHYKGEPKGIEAPASSAGGAPWAAWLDAAGDEFAVTLYGSAQCPPNGTGYKVTAPDEITVAVKAAPADCPEGYAPYTTVFHTPRNVDRYVTIQFTAQDVHFYLPPVKKKK